MVETQDEGGLVPDAGLMRGATGRLLAAFSLKNITLCTRSCFLRKPRSATQVSHRAADLFPDNREVSAGERSVH
jgi:hypothetical protein